MRKEIILKVSNKYQDYLKTDYWKRVSDAVKKRAAYRCQLCNSQHDLCAHHRTYEHRGMELNYLDDLTCLCRRCHEIFHGKAKPEPEKEKPAFVKRVRPARAGVGDIDAAQVEADMPPGSGAVVLTYELIQKCRNARGAFTNAAIMPLGVQAPLITGWADRLIGRTVSRAEYRQALEGRYIYGARGERQL